MKAWNKNTMEGESRDGLKKKALHYNLGEAGKNMKKNNDTTPLQRGIIISFVMGILTILILALLAIVMIGLFLLTEGHLYVGKEIFFGLMFFFTIEIVTIWLVALGASNLGPLIEKFSPPADWTGFPTLIMNGGSLQGVIAALIVHGGLYGINTVVGIWHPAFIGSHITMIGSASIGLVAGSIHELFDYFGWYDRMLEKVPILTQSFPAPKTHK